MYNFTTRQNVILPITARSVSNAALPSQKETLGQAVVEILRAGQNLKRKALYSRLIRRLESATGPEEEQQFRQLISMLFVTDIRQHSA